MLSERGHGDIERSVKLSGMTVDEDVIPSDSDEEGLTMAAPYDTENITINLSDLGKFKGQLHHGPNSFLLYSLLIPNFPPVPTFIQEV